VQQTCSHVTRGRGGGSRKQTRNSYRADGHEQPDVVLSAIEIAIFFVVRAGAVRVAYCAGASVASEASQVHFGCSCGDVGADERV
jgi:hypothetical protein